MSSPDASNASFAIITTAMIKRTTTKYEYEASDHRAPATVHAMTSRAINSASLLMVPGAVPVTVVIQRFQQTEADCGQKAHV